MRTADHDAIALLAATPATMVALCAGVALPEGEAPEWVPLLAAGTLTTVDGRGPYRAEKLSEIVDASVKAVVGGRLPIDENHSIDVAAPKGGPSPARGWITELAARADGIWGKVEWTAAGRELLADRAYRFLSPVIRHLPDGRVVTVLRAALTNTPNLRDAVALHNEGTDMDLLAEIRTTLGLPAEADAAAVCAAVKTLKGGGATAAQAALAPIAKAAGLKEDAEATAILAAVTTLADPTKRPEVAALQAELKTVTTQLTTLTGSIATDKATAFVDGAIKAGRVGVKPLRDHYIAQHAIDPARVEKEIGAMPVLTATGAGPQPPQKDKDGKVALNAEQLATCKVLGIKPEDMQKTLAAEAAAEAA